MGWYQRRVHGESSPVTQSNPCCSSATPLDLPFDLATPERVLRPPLIPSLVSVSSLLLSPKQQVNPSQDGHVQDQAELPRRLRGFDQQADQHGILRLLRLSLHVFILLARRPGPAWLCSPLCQGFLICGNLDSLKSNFGKESEEEREHGMKLMAYQSKRGGRCVFQDIAKPVTKEMPITVQGGFHNEIANTFPTAFETHI